LPKKAVLSCDSLGASKNVLEYEPSRLRILCALPLILACGKKEIPAPLDKVEFVAVD